MAALRDLLYRNPWRFQTLETTAWTGVENAAPQHSSTSTQDESVSESRCIKNGIANWNLISTYSGSTSLHEAPTSPSLGDSSPELEIMAVRRIKKAAQAAASSKKSNTSKPQNTNKANGAMTAQASMLKNEAFDMNLVDPALRGIDRPSEQYSMSEDIDNGSPLIGTKRAAEFDTETANKRLKEDEQSTPCLQPITSIKSDDSDVIDGIHPDGKPFHTSQPSLPPVHWLPNTWTKHDYLNLASAIDRTFNYQAYAQHIRRHPAEVVDVFRGIVLMPILDIIDRQFPTQIKNPDQAEALMLTYKQNESKLASITADEDADKLQSLKALALAEVGHDLRIQIEDEIRAQLKAEGWVQLNKAKDLIAGYEREIAETKSDAELDKKGKPRIKSMADAQRDLLTASIMFEKARKTEERKQRVAEREAKGENAKKMGRPKKGEGKGKTPDFL